MRRSVAGWNSKPPSELTPEEGDPIVIKLCARIATVRAGRDPNLQFLSLEDAAEVLAAACESNAVGVFNAAGEGTVPLKKAFAAAATTRVPILEPLGRR